ncbi:NUDIX hydrolase [Chloroflexota bacterium]
MTNPTVFTTDGRRTFDCLPAAVQGYIFNQNEDILLLKHPQRSGWEVVNGALKGSETVLQGVLRETAEEAGPNISVRPLGSIHVSSFHFENNVRYMISIHYLLEYLGGTVVPGDDMSGSQFHWWPFADLERENAQILVPVQGRWLVDRARDLYRLWRFSPDVDLQPDLSIPQKSKYDNPLE